MKSTHHLFRVISVALGLTLLMVTGTAAMIGTFSKPLTPPMQAGLYIPADPVLPAQVAEQSTDDTLLYQRVARGDGSYQWVLTEEPPTVLAARLASRQMATALVGDAPGIYKASYALPGKPLGLSKVLKDCTIYGTRLGAPSPYDLSCNSVG